MKLFIFIPSLSEATRFGLIRSHLEKTAIQFDHGSIRGYAIKMLEAKKKTFTLGMVAWIKVLLTG